MKRKLQQTIYEKPHKYRKLFNKKLNTKTNKQIYICSLHDIKEVCDQYECEGIPFIISNIIEIPYII